VKPRFDFSITYSSIQPTTGTVTATVTLLNTGTLTFVDLTGRTTSDTIVYTKTYTDNVTGEVVTFQNASGTTKTDTVNITWILPETTITYSPDGPDFTTGTVAANISFNKS
jgi:hypothetical protein